MKLVKRGTALLLSALLLAILGLVLFVDEGETTRTGETEYKLAQTIAGFLGRHMES